MPSIIQAGNAASSGIVTAGATDGILELRSGTAVGGTVAMTVDAAQNIVLAKGISVGASAAPAFSAFQSTAQTLATGINKIIFQTKEFDTSNSFSAGALSRFNPNVAGYYSVSGSFQAGVSFCNGSAVIYKNGVSFKAGESQGGQTAGTSNRWCVNALVFLNGETDYLEIYGLISIAQTLFASIDGTYFQAFLARSA